MQFTGYDRHADTRPRGHGETAQNLNVAVAAADEQKVPYRCGAGSRWFQTRSATPGRSVLVFTEVQVVVEFEIVEIAAHPPLLEPRLDGTTDFE